MILDFGFWRGPGGEGETWFSHPPARGLRPPRPSRGRGYGGTWSLYGHVRRSCAWRTTPDEHGLGARASRPRRGSAGKVTAPSLTLPPLEEGTRLLPPAGGGWEGGCTRRTMVTAAVHAALPHNAAMNIRLFLGGRSPPKPSRGWGHGETRFPHPPAGRGRGETGCPHTPLREPMFTLGATSRDRAIWEGLGGQHPLKRSVLSRRLSSTGLTRWRGAGRRCLPAYPSFPPAAARRPGETPIALPSRAGNNRLVEGCRPSTPPEGDCVTPVNQHSIERDEGARA